MSRLSHSIICIISCIFSSPSIHAMCNMPPIVTPTIVMRSQGTSNMRKLIGLADHTHLNGMKTWWGTGNAAVEYNQSFNPITTAHCLFGSDLITGGDNACQTNCNVGCYDNRTILIQGSCIEDRAATAWLADYFYLPPDYNGSITINPIIRNVNLPIDVYLGLDPWIRNTYLRVYGTVTHTRWAFNPCESNSTDPESTLGYDAGYFTREALARNRLLTSALSFLNGSTIGPIIESEDTPNITFEALRFAKFPCQTLHKTALANLWIELGWDFLHHDNYHLGAGFVFSIPTGNSRHADFTFNQVVGNGKHWQVGAVITGHYIFWRSCDEDRYFGFHFDTNLTHVLRSEEQRTFDLKCKQNSRYMLAQRMANVSDDVTLGGITYMPGTDPIDTSNEADQQFNNYYAPVANLTTFNADVRIGLQCDLAATFNFTSCNWSVDVGYNFWGNTCEDIDLDNCARDGSRLVTESWVLKGNQRNFGYTVPNANAGFTTPTPIALSASQKCATIHNGTNPDTNGSGSGSGSGSEPCLIDGNNGVDNAQIAVASTTGEFTPLSRLITGDDTELIMTSIQPCLLRLADIEFTSTRGMSHKLFTHISYTWDYDYYRPYFGVGGFAEFSRNNSRFGPSTCLPDQCDQSACTSNSDCASACIDTCVNCAISQWGVWIKGGVSWE